MQVFGDALYVGADIDGATAGSVAASLGCGASTAVADLHGGETVLDLGSGAGTDVLISAQRLGGVRGVNRSRMRSACIGLGASREEIVDRVEVGLVGVEDRPGQLVLQAQALAAVTE